MAELKAKRLSEPNTSFTKTTAAPKADVRQELLNTVVKGATIAGKSAAESAGSELSGADLSLEQVNAKATKTQESIDAGFETKTQEIGGVGPLQESTAKQIVDENLTSFATDFRTLKELRDRGVIGSTEARARSQLMLQRSLSNPLNNLFRKDFLNASAGLTGGGAGAAKALFPNTPEEERSLAIQKATNKAIAEEEAAVTTTSLKTGQSVEFVRKERQAQAIDAQNIERLKQQETQQKLNGQEAQNLHNSLQNTATRTLMSNMAALSQINGNKGLDANGMASMQRASDNDYQSFLSDINGRTDLGFAERDQLRKRAKEWKEGMDASIKLRDSNSLDTKLIAQLESQAKLIGIKNFPKLAILKQVDPRMLDLFFKLGGNTGKTFDTLAGKGAGEAIDAAAKQLSAAASFASGEVVEDIKLLPSVFNTPEGAKYVSEKGNDELRTQFRDMYFDAPEESLKLFNSPVYQMLSTKDEGVRSQVVEAMNLISGKIEFLRKNVAPDAPITVSSLRQGGQFNRPTPILDLPQDMEKYQGEIVQMFRVMRNLPWTWKHVEGQYKDEVEAFNGYMRGEFALAGVREGDAGKVADTPAGNDSNLVDADKEKELQLLIQQEEAGTLDQEGFNAMEQALSDKLDRVREGSQKIRDRAAQPNNGGRPLSPIPDTKGQPSVPVSFEDQGLFPTTGSKLNIDDLKALLNPTDEVRQERVRQFENNPKSSKSGFDGEVWTPHKSIEGGNDTLAYGHKLTDSEVKSGSVSVNGKSVSIESGLTEAQAKALFQQDWDKAGKGQRRILKANSLESLPPVAKGLLQEMVFQMGEAGVSEFKRMIKALQVGDFTEAAKQMLDSDWARIDSPERARILASEMDKLG